MPKWMTGIDAFTAPKALGLAVLLSGLKPKNLILSAAAGTTIAQAGLSAGEQGVMLAVFVVLASLAIITPGPVSRVGRGARPRHPRRVEGLASAEQRHP